MSHFIRDNTSPGSDKTDFGTSPAPPDETVAAVDWNTILQDLRDIQSYLRGVMDVVQHIDLTVNTNPAAGPEMDWVGFRGRWFAGVDVANAPTSRDFVVAGQRGTYAFNDGVTTNGSPTVTSASGGGFSAALIGSAISGAGIPAATTISAVGGPTSLTMSANATVSATGVEVTITRNTSTDYIYLKHRGGLSSTIGLGVTPPDGAARVQISPSDTEPAMGTLRLRRGPSQTGNILAFHDSTPIDRLVVDKDFYVTGDHPGVGAALVVQADATNHRPVVMTDNKSTFFGFEFLSVSLLAFKCTSSGSASFNVQTDGSLQHTGAKFGAFSAAPIVKPVVTGSRATGAALVSLLTALANLGWITDSTSA